MLCHVVLGPAVEVRGGGPYLREYSTFQHSRVSALMLLGP